MSEHIVSEFAEGVLTLRFNRADKKNALTTAMYSAAAEVLRGASSNDAVRVVVITGSGDSFSSGNDVKDFIANPLSIESPAIQFMYALLDCPKPVIAAVNGMAIGIGTTLLLHCDFAIAVPEARFQLPFVNLALVPEFASSLLLPRFLGPRKATELLMLAGPFSAEAAAEFGLINAVVPADQLAITVAAGAAALASKPPAAVRATKALLCANRDEIKACIAAEVAVLTERLKSAELREAVQAFLEKRAPDFSKFA